MLETEKWPPSDTLTISDGSQNSSSHQSSVWCRVAARLSQNRTGPTCLSVCSQSGGPDSSDGPPFVQNKYFLSLSQPPPPSDTSPVVPPRWPAVPLRQRFTHDFHCCVSAVLCLLHKHIDHFHLSSPSPFLSGAKNTFSQPILVASAHLQSSFLYPLTPSSWTLIPSTFLQKVFVSSGIRLSLRLCGVT